MDDELTQSFGELTATLVAFQERAKWALGFTSTMEYRQIFFHVAPQFVIADLSPLAFVDLVQEIEDDDVQTALSRLYERLRPLLDCRHHWLVVSPSNRRAIVQLDHSLSLRGSRILRCTACSAYGLTSEGVAIPSVGRDTSIAVSTIAAEVGNKHSAQTAH